MPEPAITLPGQSQTAISGLDRLEQLETTNVTENKTDLGLVDDEVPADKPAEIKPEPEIIPEVKPEVAAEIKPEVKPEDKPAEEKPEEGFKDEGVTATEDGTWKALLEVFELEVPADFSEEKGAETFKALTEQKHQAELEQVRNFKETEIFSTLPEPVRAEAQVTLELMKTGLTLDEIYAPIQEIKEWKAMSKEQLVRLNLEKTEGITPEEVDRQMELITSQNKLDLDYNILMRQINKYEADLNTEKQARIKYFNESQTQIKEQKRQQELNSVKAALDKMPTFMDRKLSDENKKSILADIQNGAWDKLTAADKAELIAYKRYGKQSMEYLQSRATEKATLEKAKSQHNVPIINGGGTQQETTQYKSGIDRAEKEFK